ncbi:MAG: hypothetical protein II669_00700 [Elusimicrobia bacterium]|nr:hypothetical protein [Elusimicrobiota bacterium]
MFEKELFNYIKTNFSLNNFNIKFYFGEAPQSTRQPYIVMYPLDIDGTKQVLCNENNYTDGVSYIQFSIYGLDASNLIYIKQQLDKFLALLDIIPNYRILLDNHEGARGGFAENTGLKLETLTRTFTYTTIN